MNVFSLLQTIGGINFGHVRMYMYMMPFRIWDNICIRFVTKIYRQIVGIPMGTKCAPLMADLLTHLSRRLTRCDYTVKDQKYEGRLISSRNCFITEI